MSAGTSSQRFALRAGLLNQRIALQRLTTSYSSTGEPNNSWSTLMQCWAQVSPATGEERSAAEQWIALEQTKFTIRFANSISDLSPLDRIIFPVSEAGNSPPSNRARYEIIAVHETQPRKELVILAARRVG